MLDIKKKQAACTLWLSAQALQLPCLCAQVLLYDYQNALSSAHRVNYTGSSHKNKDQINKLKTEEESVSCWRPQKRLGHRTLWPAQCYQTVKEKVVSVLVN